MKNLLFAARPLALDLLSTLVFVGLSALTHNILMATGVAMAAGAARVVWLKVRGEPVNAIQWLSLALVALAVLRRSRLRPVAGVRHRAPDAGARARAPGDPPLAPAARFFKS